MDTPTVGQEPTAVPAPASYGSGPTPPPASAAEAVRSTSESGLTWRAAPRQRATFYGTGLDAFNTATSLNTRTQTTGVPTSVPAEVSIATNTGARVPDGGDDDSQPTDVQSDLDQQVAATALRLVAEITCGLRPPHQSVSWTSASSYGWLERAYARASSLAARGASIVSVAVIGIHAQAIDQSTIECCATVVIRRQSSPTRARALAICLRRRRGTWWVTQVEW